MYKRQIHQCLECVLSSCKNKEEFDKLSRNQISKIIEKCADDYFESNMGGVIKRNARLESNLKRIKENIFKIISHLQNELKPVSYTHLDVYKRQGFVQRYYDYDRRSGHR